MNNITLHKGDCLIESDKIESGSVDLILTDLPYGNMNTDGGRKLGIKGWDIAIDPEKIYNICLTCANPPNNLWPRTGEKKRNGRIISIK